MSSKEQTERENVWTAVILTILSRALYIGLYSRTAPGAKGRGLHGFGQDAKATTTEWPPKSAWGGTRERGAMRRGARLPLVYDSIQWVWLTVRVEDDVITYTTILQSTTAGCLIYNGDLDWRKKKKKNSSFVSHTHIGEVDDVTIWWCMKKFFASMRMLHLRHKMYSCITKNDNQSSCRVLYQVTWLRARFGSLKT